MKYGKKTKLLLSQSLYKQGMSYDEIPIKNKTTSSLSQSLYKQGMSYDGLQRGYSLKSQTSQSLYKQGMSYDRKNNADKQWPHRLNPFINRACLTTATAFFLYKFNELQRGVCLFWGVKKVDTLFCLQTSLL